MTDKFCRAQADLLWVILQNLSLSYPPTPTTPTPILPAFHNPHLTTEYWNIIVCE